MCNILVDEYTRRGLFRHLQQNSGCGLLAYEELTSFFDQVHRRQLEGSGERQMFCRSYDSGRWTSSVGECKTAHRMTILLLRRMTTK